MNRKSIVLGLVALVLFVALFYFYAGRQTPAGQPPLAELNRENFTSIGTAFNAAKDDVRVLLLLSPT